MTRIATFLEDLVIIAILLVVAALAALALNPPSQAAQSYCHLVNGDGLDFMVCIADKSI